MQISKVLRVGDVVYSSANGQPTKTTKIYSVGFDTEVDYFSFDEHRKLFWLTKAGYLDSVRQRRADNAT